jgi:ribosomal protein S19
MGVITLTGLTINTLYNYYTKIIYSYNVIQQSNTGNSFTTNGNYLNMAYSTRLLNPTYTGAVIRVRNGTNYGDIYTNSSQSTFTMGSFGSTTTYANWIGSNVGYVEIWYDQSGKSNHAYNSTANSSQPLLTSINSTSGNSYYVIKWIKDNSTFLNITTPFIPKTIFCQWQNNNNIFGTFISKNNVGVGLRFDGGTQFSLPVVTQRNDINDFLYHAKDNISVYNNGVNTINGNITTTSYSITNYRCILLQGSTNYNSRMWNICSLSIDSTTLTDVTSYGFNQIGTDSYSNTRSINGYMVEIMCYNHATTDNDMLNYYNSALFNNN